MIRFNADEILEIAEQIERNGAAFYRRAAASKDGAAKELLGKLAGMEDGHEATFAEMRMRLSSKEAEPCVFDPDGLNTRYLQAMADGYVFDRRTSPAEKLSGRETMEEILRMAIGAEKDSIVFYLGVRDMVPPALGKGRVDQIIEEEMSHIALLSKELREASE